MTSVFDLPDDGPEPPTLEEFLESIGSPFLQFALEDGAVAVPPGLLACCRVVHQQHCQHHVAGSLIGCEFTILYQDAEVQHWKPIKQSFPGDVLARPRDFAAAIQATALVASSTAQAGGGKVSQMRFNIWLLNLEQAEMWKYLEQEQKTVSAAMLEASDQTSSEEIEALPVVLLDDRPNSIEIALAMARPTFRHAQAYARRVLIMPSEIGHDERARYITSPVWGEANDVPPAVDAILADPVRSP